MSESRSNPRFNPWPYSIIGFFTLAIAAAVAWVGFCLGHGTDLVAEDYYEQEVEYQNQLDRLAQTRALSDRASVSYDSKEGHIRIQLPPDHAMQGLTGSIHLYRPSKASLDQDIPLNVTAVGQQQLDVHGMAPGLWDVRVQWASGGREYFLNEMIHIVGNGS